MDIFDEAYETYNSYSSVFNREKDMLKFAGNLEASDNAFLREFSQYLKECYKSGRFEERPDCDWRMEKLDEFLSWVYLLPTAPVAAKGCALLGGTPFGKLELVRAFLETHGVAEYAEGGPTENCYAVVDCCGKAKRDHSLMSAALKYRDVPFVIFDNCENILKMEENLILFKHLIEPRRGERTISVWEKIDGSYQVAVKSCYILLGSEDKRNELLARTPPALRESVQYRIYSFRYFIKLTLKLPQDAPNRGI